MGKSQRLRFRDLRKLYLLVGECCEVGSDPIAWHKRMAEGLSEIFDSRLGISGMIASFDLCKVRYTDTAVLGFYDWGWDSLEQRKTFQDYCSSGLQATDPVILAFNKIPGQMNCRRLFDVLTEEQWYGSEHYQACYRHWNVHDILFSLSRRPTQTGVGLHWINIGRDIGQQPFSVRDKRMFHLFRLEIHRLLGEKLVPFGGVDILRLTPRLMQVLGLLTEGLSEKQVAGKLDLSIHTVHGYIKKLYRHFEVSSRSELLAKWHNIISAGLLDTHSSCEIT